MRDSHQVFKSIDNVDPARVLESVDFYRKATLWTEYVIRDLHFTYGVPIEDIECDKLRFNGFYYPTIRYLERCWMFHPDDVVGACGSSLG